MTLILPWTLDTWVDWMNKKIENKSTHLPVYIINIYLERKLCELYKIYIMISYVKAVKLL